MLSYSLVVVEVVIKAVFQMVNNTTSTDETDVHDEAGTSPLLSEWQPDAYVNPKIKHATATSSVTSHCSLFPGPIYMLVTYHVVVIECPTDTSIFMAAIA